MGMLKLNAVVMLFLLIGVPIVFLVGEAYAGCCTCDMACDDSCLCPGTWPCASCVVGQSGAIKSNPSVSDGTSSTPVVRKPAASIATNSHMLDRLIRAGQTGQCAVNNFALRLLADGQKLLKLDPMFLNAYASQDNAVALRITGKY